MPDEVPQDVIDQPPMRVVLQIESGPFTGRKVLMRANQILMVGRTERADYALPHDNQLSSRHFALETDAQNCRIRDLDSRNGTLVNGIQVEQATLQDGDEVVAGQTRFSVHIELATAAEAVATPLAPVPAPLSPTAAKPESESKPAGTSPKPQSAAPRPRRPSVSGIVSPWPFQQALDDESALVRSEALWAAAWSKQTWLLDHCRRLCKEPSPDDVTAVLLLAILGKASDLEQILALENARDLGPHRYRAVGAFGHPAVMDTILKALSSSDPRDAVAAGNAFHKITGVNVESVNRVQLPPDDGREPDEFEREFLDEPKLPDPQKATEHWQKVKDQFAKGTRWCRGFDLSQGASPEVLEQLDMESRMEVCLRGRMAGTWKGTIAHLEPLGSR